MIKEILNDRILVGHGIDHDLEILQLIHPNSDKRDTAVAEKFLKPLRSGKPKSKFRANKLKYLAKLHLDLDIQTGEHDSIEDSKAVMMLYAKFQDLWDICSKFSAAPLFWTKILGCAAILDQNFRLRRYCGPKFFGCATIMEQIFLLQNSC